MKKEILQLAKEGKSYREIQKELKCSKGTISYHLGKGQKEKSTIRRKKLRNTAKDIISRKLDLFLNRNKERIIKYSKRDSRYKIVQDRLIKNPVCYLTGDVLDLTDSKSYSLDHVIPFCVSQDNSIDNLKLCSRKANASKTDMSVSEYIELCKKVLKNFSYKIIEL